MTAVCGSVSLLFLIITIIITINLGGHVHEGAHTGDQLVGGSFFFCHVDPGHQTQFSGLVAGSF